MVGRKLGHYEIVGKLGAGGMGEVYLAQDTKLDRKVALKLLPADLAEDRERRMRFEREAKAVAALNHPNIVTIFAVEQDSDLHFITMELVDGKPLSELIPQQGFPVDKLLEYGIALSDAVSAAHRQGITHRDLKPANVMISTEGRLKVLDFGLAKLQGETAPKDRDTRTASVTQEGKVLGTVAYMSPEQAEGKPVDSPSDVFSMGILLYEMATGQRPFEGDTPISTITSILRDTPTPATELNRTLPRQLGRILKRSLAKDPDRRYQSAQGLHSELLELQEERQSGDLPEAGRTVSSSKARRSRLVPALGAIALLAVALLIYVIVSRPTQEASDRITGTATAITDRGGPELEPSLSPDGKTVTYAAPSSDNWDIFVQRVGGQNPLNLTPDSAAEERDPAFSPDGERIAFRSERDGGGIFAMGATGESVTRITDFGHNPAWSPDGEKIAFATERVINPLQRIGGSGLWVADVESGELEQIFAGDAVQPSWSPNGERIAFWAVPVDSGERDIWTIRADGGEPVAVTQDPSVDWNPVWAPDGRHLYFVSDRAGIMNIWHVPIDEASGTVEGEPRSVTSGVAAWSHQISISADERRLVYTSSVLRRNVRSVGFDPDSGTITGGPVPITRGSRLIEFCDPSPDGTWLACATGVPQEDIFVVRLDGGERRQLTNDPAKDRVPFWFPDGERIVFYSDRGGSYDVWSVRPDGSGLTQLTDTAGKSTLFPIVSPDGRQMIYQVVNEGNALVMDLTLPLGEQSPQQISTLDENNEWFLAWDWSSDAKQVLGHMGGAASLGRGVAVMNMQSGEVERISDRGLFPVWLADDRRFLCYDAGRMSIGDVETGGFRELLSLFPDQLGNWSIRLAHDQRSIFFTHENLESDIWLLELD